jgi:hypothetical protein
MHALFPARVFAGDAHGACAISVNAFNHSTGEHSMSNLNFGIRTVGRTGLFAAALVAAAASNLSHAVNVTNLSSNTVVFAEDFESGALAPSVGTWLVTGNGAMNTVLTGTSPPDPGPAEGARYLRASRSGNDIGDLLARFDSPVSEVGDVVRLSAMVYLQDDGANTRLQLLLQNGSDFQTARAWARPDGLGNVIAVSSTPGGGFLLTDTGIDYTPGTWQRWDLKYTVGANTFDVSVDGVSALGLAAYSAGQVSTAYMFNGNSIQGSLYLDAVPIPEPGTWALLLAGLLFVAAAAAKRGRVEEATRP